MKSRLGHLPTPWKYGLISLLAFIGISTAVPHLAGLTHQAPPEQPQPTSTVSASQQVNAAEAATPTQSPTPTITPSPTAAYIPPTKVYTPPTQAPAEQSSNQLDNNSYYTNVDGNQVHSPAGTVDGSVPAGATAQCGDGTYSFSQHHSGACSHHGGVAQWL